MAAAEACSSAAAGGCRAQRVFIARNMRIGGAPPRARCAPRRWCELDSRDASCSTLKPPPPARPGADPSAVDEDGGDALWWATEQGHAAVVARLQGAGDMMGETPRCVCHPRHQRSSAKLFWFE